METVTLTHNDSSSKIVFLKSEFAAASKVGGITRVWLKGNNEPFPIREQLTTVVEAFTGIPLLEN